MGSFLFFSLLLNVFLASYCVLLWCAFLKSEEFSSSAHDAFIRMRDLYDAQRRKQPTWAGAKRRLAPTSNVIAGPGYDGPGVYVIRCLSRYKIGQSRNVTKRLRSFGTSIPFAWSVYTIIPTAHPEALEAHFHEVLASYRVQGEWFDFGDDLAPLTIVMDRVREEAA